MSIIEHNLLAVITIKHRSLISCLGKLVDVVLQQTNTKGNELSKPNTNFAKLVLQSSKKVGMPSVSGQLEILLLRLDMDALHPHRHPTLEMHLSSKSCALMTIMWFVLQNCYIIN